VQLHVHSQWKGARFEDGRWKMTGGWSILKRSRSDMERMISDCRAYLESLIRRVAPEYRCQSFRSGAWAIAPSEHILSVLAEQGIVFDMSICKGIKYDNEVIQLDYSDCEEDLLPFYPVMSDARRVATGRSPIACVPTFSFVPRRRTIVSDDVDRFRQRLHRKIGGRTSGVQGPGASAPPVASTNEYEVWRTHSGIKEKIMQRLNPERAIADLSALSGAMIIDMLDAVRRAADLRGVRHAPIILENHTKDITDFRNIELFASLVARSKDFEVITLKEVARRLMCGDYPVIHKPAAAA
jgi:hypothetical protein